MDNLGNKFRASLLNVPEHRQAFRNAPIWKRAVSFLADLLLLNMTIFAPFSKTFTSFVENTESLMGTTIPSEVYFGILSISFVALLYFAIFQNYFQQTIGMMLTGLYVHPRPGFWKAVFRNIFILPFFPFNLLWIIEPVYLFFNKRRLLEKFTKTNTVEEKNG